MRSFSIRSWLLLCALSLSACATAATSSAALTKAVIFNDAKAVQSALAAGVDPNSQDETGNPLLIVAMREKSVDVAKLLINHPKIDLEAVNKAGENAMMMAALQGLTPMVQRLIDKDAEVNKHGWAPLHYAATNGYDDIVALLIEHSAYIDAESPNGTTPLMMAARSGHLSTCQVLLDGGADVRLKNQLGMTAIDFAKRANQKEIANVLAARLRKPQSGWY